MQIKKFLVQEPMNFIQKLTKEVKLQCKVDIKIQIKQIFQDQVIINLP